MNYTLLVYFLPEACVDGSVRQELNPESTESEGPERKSSAESEEGNTEGGQ